MSHPDQELIRRALARQPQAATALVDRLSTPIQRQVNAALARRRRGTRQDVRDLTQDVFRILLDQDGKILRAWSPDKGASLEGYVGMVAQRKVASMPASGRKSGHSEDAQDPLDFDDAADEGESPEMGAMSRDLLQRVLQELRVGLSDQGFEMFRVLVVEEREVAWVQDHYGMTRDAVYAWRSRVLKAARKIAQNLMSDSGSLSGKIEQGGRA